MAITHKDLAALKSAEFMPILQSKYGGPVAGVPWAVIEPHEKQAQINHGQTLRGLANRGGLSWCEMCAVLKDRKWRKMDDDHAQRDVLNHVVIFYRAALLAIIQEAVLKERERCAGIAERYTDGVYAAEAIRQEPGNTIEQAAQPAQATVTREDIAAVVGPIMLAALRPSPKYAYDGTYTRWGLVEKDLTDAILKLIGQSGEEAVSKTLLDERDSFIVHQGLWMKFVDWIRDQRNSPPTPPPASPTVAEVE